MNYTPALHNKTDSLSFVGERCVVLLLPLVWSIYTYGARALFVTVLSVLFAEAVYLAYAYFTKSGFSVITVLDIVVSACIFAFAMPASVPYYIPMLGGILSALPSLWLFGGRKILFGGALAVTVMRTLLPSVTFRTTEAFQSLSPWKFAPDSKYLESLITRTPLQLLGEGKVSSGTLWEQLFGVISGNLGEISIVLLLVAGVFLVIRKKLRPIPPAVFLFSLGMLSLCFPKGDSEDIFYMLVSLLSGGVVLGAVFVFSDNQSMPITDMGKIVFGLGLTLIVGILRYSGLALDGVYFGVTVMGLITPAIDKFTLPVAYGRTKVKKKK